MLRLRTLKPVHSLIVGFVVKDKQGQPLFGDNTFLQYLDRPVSADAGAEVRTVFEFRIQILPIGNYAASLAVVDGTQKDNAMHQWIHDALSSRLASVSTGLVGIPRRRIECTIRSVEAP